MDGSIENQAKTQQTPKDPRTPHLLQIFVVVSFLHPLLQQGPQLTHVLETELQSFKTADGCLAEHLPWGGQWKEKQSEAEGNTFVTQDPGPPHLFLPSQDPIPRSHFFPEETQAPSIFPPSSLPSSCVGIESTPETPFLFSPGEKKSPEFKHVLPGQM